MISKGHLRKVVLQYRKLLDAAEYERRNKWLCDQVFGFIKKGNFKSVHFFLPIKENHEPDFTSIFPLLWDQEIEIQVSKTDLKTKTMLHFWLEPTTKLAESKWGIPEPQDAKPAELSDAELIIVPLLLGDQFGHRLGYGGGYYDKLLNEFKGVTLGVSLAPLVDRLPSESWDVPVKEILFFH